MDDRKNFRNEGASSIEHRRVDWLQRGSEALALLAVVLTVVYLTHWLAAGDALAKL